jgi:RND family efflux transporter MFP subunit
MTHTTSDQSVNKLPDQTNEELVEPEQSPPPKLAPKGWGLLLGGVLVLAGGTWGVLQLTRSSHTPEAALTQAIAVETVEIRPQQIVNTLELSGTIRPIDQATLSTRVMGRINQLLVESGDRFQKGDILAQIDVMDMTAQTSQAQSGVAQAQAEVARSQATLSQLEAQKLEVQASLRMAQLNQSRMAQLQAQGAVARSQLDQANTTLAEIKARIAQTEAGIQQAQAAIAQSRAAVNRAESAVASASVSESYGNVIAPFDGVVVQKLAYAGEMAAPGTALLKVENPDRLQLEISVPEENLRFVRVNQLVEVRVDAVNQTLNGRIQQIVTSVDPNSRSFLVKIHLNNSGRLISGMFGRIALPKGTQDGISIPTTALIQRGQLQGVYIVETTNLEQSKAVLRWVKTGKTQAGQVEIVSGLMTVDRIVTNNIGQLSDGQAIAIQE